MKRGIIFIILFILQIFSFAGDGNGDVKKLIKQGLRLRNVNKFEAAEAKYKEALALEADNFEAHFQLGLLYESAFYDKEKSHQEFLLAEKAMPSDTVYELFFELGQSFHYFEKYQTAINYYNRYKLGIKPDSELIGNQVSSRIKECEFALQYDNHVYDGLIKNLGESINTNFSEYIPVYVKRDSALLFTRRGSNNLGDYYWDNMYYEDMYISKIKNGSYQKSESFGKASDYTGEVKNSKKHESVVDINTREDTLILYQENKLWYSIFEKGKWRDPIEFEGEINISKYQRHGCLNANGTQMIYSSDFKEGMGGYDLYSSTLGSDGKWSEGVSLGPVINTDKDEDSPFLSDDGSELYFSSKGHNGMGGYDVFYSKKEGSGWSTPINLGTPINSPAEDIYFKKERNGDQIFISSNRMGGFGNMDIYTFVPYGIPLFKDCDVVYNKTYRVAIDAEASIDQEGAPLVYQWELGDGSVAYGKTLEYYYKRPGSYPLKLNVIDSLTGRIIEDEDLVDVEGNLPITVGEGELHIEATGVDTVQVGETIVLNTKHSQLDEGRITNAFWKLKSGELVEKDSIEYTFEEIGSEKLYMEIIGRKDNGDELHYCTTKEVIVLSEEDFLALTNNKDSTNETGLNIGSNLDDNSIISLPDGTTYELANIYFNFDKSFVRRDARKTMDANIKALKGNPKLVIKVVGHTDAMGANSYNRNLSERRAKAAVAYLIKKGIDVNRIKATLFEGESDPAAPNINPDGTDNPQGRQLNRRVEFYVVGTIK